MVKLTEEMKAAFSSVRVFPVATASKDGIPNVVPIGFCMLVGDDTIWIADNFMKKSLANLRENPKAAIYVWGADTKGCFQIKGDVSIVTEGEDFQKMREIVLAKMSQAPAKSLIVVSITEVFSCTPGPGAGDRIPMMGQ
jgi:predicted pyridoxine 5'-phosphate oxidase superfamily flavin-nucleotide-binding protein